MILFALGLFLYIFHTLRKNNHANNNKAIRKHLSAISLEEGARDSSSPSGFRGNNRKEEYFTVEEDETEDFSGHKNLMNATRIITSTPINVQSYVQKPRDDDSTNPLMK